MKLATAIVVARGGSTRLPNKAMLPFGSSTLIGHKVRTLKQCLRIGRVVVGSDSDAILAEAAAHGAETVKRSDYHCDERVCSANEMILNMVSLVDGGDDDVFVWAHPTNPLIRPETYDAAVDRFAAGLEFRFDSLMSVREERRHAWFRDNPLNFTPHAVPHQTAAQLEPVLFQDGAIFIQTRARWLETAYFYGERPLHFPVPFDEGWDVDTRGDYEVAVSLAGNVFNASKQRGQVTLESSLVPNR
jgi:CMP-N-acetylneuraminic acid synthetase